MAGLSERLKLARRASQTAAIVVASSGALVLVGWVFEIAWLKSPLASSPTMKPNTALALMLGGVSLWLSTQPAMAAISRWLAAIVVLIGGTALVEYAFGIDLGIDQLLFRDTDPLATPKGRMAIATAVCFVALGCSSLAAATTRGVWLAERLALLAAAISGVAVVGYLYDARALLRVGPFTAIAVHTAVLIFVQAIGRLLSHSLHWIAVPVSETYGGASARRLLPVAILVPVVTGWLILGGEQAGWYSGEFGLALLTIATILVFTMMIWGDAKSLIVVESRQRKAEEDLRRLAERQRADARFGALLEAAPDAIVIVDPDGRLVLVNDQVERLFGYARNDLIGQPIEMLMPERFGERHVSHRQAFVREPRARPMGVALELFGRRRDGSEFPVEISLSPLQTGDELLIMAAVRNVTDRKALQARLQASVTEKELLLKELHHRVKNNLQVIASMLRLQSQESADPATAAAFSTSQDRVQTIAAMHESLRHSGDLAEVDMAGYVDRLIDGLRSAYGLDASRISVRTNVENLHLPMDIAVTCGLLVNELVSNAFKHAFPGGRRGEVAVTIARRDGGVCLLEVADTGVGLPAGIEPGTSRTLGLQIVTTLAAQLEGTLEIHRGGGTRFVINTREATART